MQNDYKEKLRALLEALETQRIDELMERGKVGDFRNYGKEYVKAVKGKIDKGVKEEMSEQVKQLRKEWGL